MESKSNKISWLISSFSILLISIGVFLRFTGMNWNLGANLHPDEYGLTNTLASLSFPHSFSEYFNTRISPISPYNKYDLSGQPIENGADNRMRWGQLPILIIRGFAELTRNTGYDELRLIGRYISAIVDVLSLLFIFLIGKRLYGYQVGLLAAGLSSLAVLQIQHSHFMTVDNYAVLFTTVTMYAAVRVAQSPPLMRKSADEAKTYTPYQFQWSALKWYLLFGGGLGLALASKINLLPLAGMALVASFLSIADLKLNAHPDIEKIFSTAALLVAASWIFAALIFRVAQPMSFRAPAGDTTLMTFYLNPDWVESMKVAQQESSGNGGGPPSEQWANRAVIIYPLMNLVVWGMGFPLGLAAWYGWGKAAWTIFRGATPWRAHVLPVVWSGGFFLFMATRWVKSMRYFLPIYPFLCLLAAWGVMHLIEKSTAARKMNKNTHHRQPIHPAVIFLVVTIGTLIWAAAFTKAVYIQPNTRIQASRWIYENVPGPVHIQITSTEGSEYLPVSIPDGLFVNSGTTFQQTLISPSGGKLGAVILPHVRNNANEPVELILTLTLDADRNEVIDQLTIPVPLSIKERGESLAGNFDGGELIAGQRYYLTVSTISVTGLTIYRNIIASEDWDEGLPVGIDGYDPYGQFYRGVTMPVRWTDDENKRQKILENLDQVDFIILASQRSIWSICRLQKMYPMTIAYYRALFDGRLGFELTSEFQAPLNVGSLEISDAGGTLAWNSPPTLPLFNFNFFAAEEAFSVYDHPPVWIFKKTADYSDSQAHAVLGSIDLTGAEFQSPKEVRVVPIK